jgi:membrane-bound lytic murein transglycosylase A
MDLLARHGLERSELVAGRYPHAVIRSAPWLGLALAFLLSACGPSAPIKPPPEALSLAPVRFADLTGWAEDDVAAALPALKRSCDSFLKQDDAKPVGPDGLAGMVADWRPICAQAAKIPDAAGARQFFETYFAPFLANANDGPEGLFTGYFEMELHGSLTPDQRFSTPIYRRPEDLIQVELGDFRADWKGQRIAGRVISGKLKPYWSRSEIQAGALAKKQLELVWVDDPVDSFFLEIQGSGRVSLPDGRVMRLGYEAANGLPYFAIGRDLVSRGILSKEEVSMQSIRAWLAAHPQELQAELALNPSYVFFREAKGDGPLGAQGVALTERRSMAVDASFVPLGVPLWLDLAEEHEPGGHIRRLVVAQDTGGAIKGPVRGDLFWGFGQVAAERAGQMKAHGRYYLLLPKTVAERRLRAS